MQAIDRIAPIALAGLAAAATAWFHVQGAEAERLFAGIAAILFACLGAIQANARLGAVATAAWCAVANGYLLYDKVAGAGTKALCTVSEKIDCSAVNSSEASELGGIPITLFGLAFYLGLGAAGSLNLPRFNQANGLFAILSLAYSAYLADVSRQLGIWCPFCLSIYAGNLLLFWSALRGLKEEKASLWGDLGGVFSSRAFSVITAAFVLLTAGGLATLPASKSKPPVAQSGAAGGGKWDPTAALVGLIAQPEGEVVLRGDEPRYGRADAPYTIVEWADYGCPHCARAARDLKKLVDSNPDIQLRFKVFPLSGHCNSAIPKHEADNGDRCLAGVAAVCAGRQGRFFEMSNAIFTNQRYLDPESLKMMAEQSGVDVNAWTACLSSTEALAEVVSDAEAGVRAGVHGTPAMYLQGTHGARTVLITHGADAVQKVVEAHRDGVTMPEPRKLEHEEH